MKPSTNHPMFPSSARIGAALLATALTVFASSSAFGYGLTSVTGNVSYQDATFTYTDLAATLLNNNNQAALLCVNMPTVPVTMQFGGNTQFSLNVPKVTGPTTYTKDVCGIYARSYNASSPISMSFENNVDISVTGGDTTVYGAYIRGYSSSNPSCSASIGGNLTVDVHSNNTSSPTSTTSPIYGVYVYNANLHVTGNVNVQGTSKVFVSNSAGILMNSGGDGIIEGKTYIGELDGAKFNGRGISVLSGAITLQQELYANVSGTGVYVSSQKKVFLAGAYITSENSSIWMGSTTAGSGIITDYVPEGSDSASYVYELTATNANSVIYANRNGMIDLHMASGSKIENTRKSGVTNALEATSGADIKLTTDKTTITGDLNASSSESPYYSNPGSINLTMTNGSTLTGKSTTDNFGASGFSKGSVNLTLQTGSVWNITGNSTITSLSSQSASILSFSGTNTATDYTRLTMDGGTATLADGTEVTFEMDKDTALTLTNANTFSLIDTTSPGSSISGNASQITFNLPTLKSWRDDKGMWAYVWDTSNFMDNGTLKIKLSKIPEPTTATLGLLGFSCLLMVRRRA